MPTIDIIVNSSSAARSVAELEAKFKSLSAELEEGQKIFKKGSAQYENEIPKMAAKVKAAERAWSTAKEEAAQFGTVAKAAMADVNVGGFVRRVKTTESALASVKNEAKQLVTIFNLLKASSIGNQEYSDLLDVKASVNQVEYLNGLFNKQAVIRSQIKGIQEGSFVSAQKELAIEEAKLAVAKQTASYSTLDMMGDKTSYISKSDLTDVQKINALVDSGLASRLKVNTAAEGLSEKTKKATFSQKALKDMIDATTISYVKMTTGASSVNYSKQLAAQYAINKQKQLEDGLDKTILSGESKILAVQTERMAIEKGITQVQNKELATQSALLAIEKQRSGVSTIQSGMTERSYQAKLINETNDLTTAQKLQAMQALGLIDKTEKLAKASGDASKAQKNLHGAIRGVAGGLGQLWMAYGTVLPLMAAFATAATAKKAASSAIDFEYQSTFAAVLAQEAEVAKGSTVDLNTVLEDTRKRLLDIEGLSHTPTELADGFLELVKAGQTAEEAIASIETASKFSVIAGVDMEASTRALVTQVTAWGDQLDRFGSTEEKVSHVGDVLAKAANETVTSLPELTTAMSYMTELATTTGSSFEELAAATAMLSQKGIFGSKGGQALRTSITRLVAPSEKAQQIFSELNYTFSAFTSEGKKKGVIDIFTELAKVTDKLSDEKSAILAKELFGLRSGKAGINVIKQINEGLGEFTGRLENSSGYLDTIYGTLKDTTKVKLNVLAAEFEKALIKAVDTDAMGSFVDTLINFVQNDFQSVATSVISAIQGITSAVGALLSLQASLPGDIMDQGIVAYILFGSNPVGKIIAALTLVSKKMQELNDETGASTEVGGDFFQWQGLPSFEKLVNDYTDLEKAVKVVQDDMKGAWGSYLKYLNNAAKNASAVDVDINLIDTGKTKESEKAIKSSLDTVKDLKEAEAKYLVESNKNWAEQARVINKVSKSYDDAYDAKQKTSKEDLAQGILNNKHKVIRGISEIENAYEDFGVTAKLAWDDIKDNSMQSTDEQLKAIDAMKYFSAPSSLPTGYTQEYDEAGGSVYAKDIEYTSNGVKKFSKDYAYVLDSSKTQADKFFENFYQQADDTTTKQIAAAQRYSDELGKVLGGSVTSILSEFSGMNIDLGKLMDLGSSDEQLSKIKSVFDEIGVSGIEAFSKISKEAGSVLDDIKAKQQVLLSQIKGYSNDIAGARSTAGNARFDLAQDNRDPDEQYAASLSRANYKLAESERAMSLAMKLSGSAREDMYEKAKSLASEALSLSNDLTSSEENKVSKQKAYSDSLKIINSYESTMVKNAAAMDKKARTELKSWESVKKDLESTKKVADEMLKLFTTSQELDLNTDSAKDKIQEIVDLTKKIGNVDTSADMDSGASTNANDLLMNMDSMKEGMNEFGSTSTQVIDRVYSDGSYAFIQMTEQVSGLTAEINKAADAFKGMDGISINVAGTNAVKRATGGIIPGWGGGDVVPALLEPGEFVVRKEAVKNYGKEQFEQMNAMKFQTGGYVGAKKQQTSTSDSVNINIHDHSSGDVMLIQADRENAEKLEKYMNKSRRFRS